MTEKMDKYPPCQTDYIEVGITYKPKSDATVLSGNDSVKSPDDMNKKAQEEIKAHQMPLK